MPIDEKFLDHYTLMCKAVSKPDRLRIINLLNDKKFNVGDMVVVETARGMELGKDCSTISREILKHSVESRKLNYNRIQNLCIQRRNCNHFQWWLLTYSCFIPSCFRISFKRFFTFSLLSMIS